VFGVAKDELERVLTGWKFYSRFRLARAKMKVRFVLRNRFLGIERFIHVYQQMVMAAVRVIVAGVRNAHVAQAEAAPESAFDDGAVLRSHEIEKGILVCGLVLSGRGEWQASERR